MTFSSPSIESIRIEAFRGFRDARQFDLSASAVIVTGPNGTGKTSFFDALQWGLLGRLERLEGLRSRRNVEHVVNQYRLGRKASVEIQLRLESGTVRVRRIGDQSGSTLELERQGSPSVFGDEAESELRQMLLPRSELTLESAMATSGLMQQDVLRRVLEAKPADRYQQLSAVLGLSALEDFEGATKSAAKQASDREAEARSEHVELAGLLGQARDRLEIAQVRLASRPQIEAVRDEVLSRLRATPDGVYFRVADLKLESLDEVRTAAAKVSQAAESIDTFQIRVAAATGLAETLAKEPSTQDIETLRTDSMRAEAAMVAAESARGAAQSELNSARLAAADMAKLAALVIPILTNSCPVCGQQIDRAHVERELLERGEATETLLELERVFVERANAFSVAAAASLAANDALVAAEKQRQRWNELREAEQQIAIAAEILASSAAFLEFESATPDFFAANTESLSEYLRQSRRVLHDLLETFDRQSEQGAIERATAEIASLEAALRAAEIRLKEESARSRKLRMLAERTLDARVEVTEQRLRSIQPLVANIFQRLDPHPAFKTVEFELDTYYRRGTTSPLVIDPVASISADPLLIFSTSQANIVALSYFIAMSLSTEQAGLPFLLLDDPVQSMDDVNVLGFADLCRHLRLRRQLIVSTHERRLSGLLERKLAPRSEGSDTKVIRFTGWDRSGPAVEEHVVERQLVDQPIRLLRQVS